MIRAVTFDVDGTLYDAARIRWPMIWKNLTRLAGLRVGRRVREELRTRAFESGHALREEEARIVGERMELPAAKARALLDDIFDRTLCEVLPRAREPELPAALRALAERGVKLGAVSDRRIDDKLRALDLDPGLFEARLSADDSGLLKPNPEILARASSLLGVPMADLLHIGDRDDADGELARRAGARFVLVGAPVDTIREVRRLGSDPSGLPDA